MVSLEERMQNYEKELDVRVPENKFLVVRLDGHKFSKRTPKEVYNVQFAEAMRKTLEVLVESYPPTPKPNYLRFRRKCKI